MAAANQTLKDLSLSENSKKSSKNAPKATQKKKDSKKTEGAALIGVDVKKEVDLPEWYDISSNPPPPQKVLHYEY